MSKEKEYFLKDETIKYKEDDCFGHEDIANNIANIIKTQNMPYNIALIGKWGTGKSSTIELVKRKLSNSDEYKFVEINAWKYEKEELRRTLLKQTFEGIGEKKEKNIIQKELKNFTSTVINEEKNEKISFGKRLWTSVKAIFNLCVQSVIVFLIITVIYMVGYYILKLIQGEEIILKDYIQSYIKSDFVKKAVISFLVPLIKEFIDVYRKRGLNIWRIEYPKRGTDEYEELLKNYLSSFKKKVIIVLDDIDRLTTPKVVEALDAIKAFAEFEEIIFIVPFDDNVLKKALTASEKEYQADTLMVQSELFLDKLFQFKIYMPPLPEYDIKEYVINLCKEKGKELITICGNNFDEIINEVLIHPNVNNPRQVKKILNNFLNNFLIARARDNKRVEEGLFTSEEGIKIIAKLSVLQCDFNEFYDELVNDFELERKFLNFYNDINPQKELPKNLKEIADYFNGNKLKDKYLPLANYLTLTSEIKTDNISSYIYMSQDKLGIEIGDKKQKEIKQALESKNITNIIECIESDKENVNKVIKNQLEVTKINTNVLTSVINCSHLLSNDFIKEISNYLIKKLNNLHSNNKISDYLEYNIENMIEIYLINDCDILLEKIIICIIEKSLEKDDSKRKTIECLLKNNDKVGNDLKIKIKEIIEKIFLGSIVGFSIQEFINIIQIDDFDINYYLGIKSYNQLCKYMQENEYYNEKAIEIIILLAESSNENKNYDEYLKEITNWINIEDLLEIMQKIVNIMPKKMSKKISNQIISEINIDLLKDKAENIVKIIEKLNYQVDEKNKSIMDKNFTAIEKNVFINEIVKEMCENDEIKYLEELSNSISEQLTTDDGYIEMLDDILLSYSQIQLEHMNKLITPFYNSHSEIKENNIVNVVQISKSLIKNKLIETKMKSNLESGITSLATYYSFEIWANWMIELIGENILTVSEEYAQSYNDLICKLFKDSSYKEFAIKAIKFMSGHLEGTKLDKIIEVMLEQNIDLNKNNELMEKLMSNSKTDYNADYIDVMIKQISNDNYANFKDILDKKIEYIDDLSYINAISKLNIDMFNLTISTVEKIYTIKDSIIYNLLNICEDYEKIKLLEERVFQQIKELKNINISLVTSAKGMNNLLRIIIDSNFSKADVYEGIKYVLENIDEDNLTETLNIIEGVDVKYYPKRREKIDFSECLYSNFCNTSSKEIKTEICMIIKKLGMREQFIRREFNDEDKNILNEI